MNVYLVLMILALAATAIFLAYRLLSQQLRQNRDAFQDSFKNLAAQALEGNSKQLLEAAKAQLEKESALIKGDMGHRQSAIEEMLKPLRDSVERYQRNVEEMEKQRQRSYSLVENGLKELAEGNLRLARETSALKNALKKPNTRGRWGELQLKNCVELAGMSEFSDVTFQDLQEVSGGQRLIPDMTVKMPGGHIVVVDAKTPTEAFFEALEAESEELRREHLARHGRHVKDHIRVLATKGYGAHLEASADFTVMFLPNESFLYAALEAEPDIVEFALQRKVLIASPPTLVGLLKVIQYGWNEERLAESARKISEVGKELHERVCSFMEAYTSVGKSLERAQAEYDRGMQRLNSRILVSAKKLEKLGAKSQKNLGAGAEIEESHPEPT